MSYSKIPQPFADSNGIPCKETYWAISAFERMVCKQQKLAQLAHPSAMWRLFELKQLADLEKACYSCLFLVVERAT